MKSPNGEPMHREYDATLRRGTALSSPAGASLSTVWREPRRRRIVVAMDNKPKLVIIVGSVREGRFGPTVASWVAEQALTHGAFDVAVVDLADIDVPWVLPAASRTHRDDFPPRRNGATHGTPGRRRRIHIVTPEYKPRLAASLKAAIDWHFTQWAAKAVAFVSYGGAAGGRHAVLHLENVLTELHAVTIRDGLAGLLFTTWPAARSRHRASSTTPDALDRSLGRPRSRSARSRGPLPGRRDAAPRAEPRHLSRYGEHDGHGRSTTPADGTTPPAGPTRRARADCRRRSGPVGTLSAAWGVRIGMAL
ncbi:hypothetical protein SMICM304S_10093 [Streptomyces microflavus]